MGASIARIAKTRGLARQIIGVDSDVHTRDLVRERGWVDLVWGAPNVQCGKADMIIVATPVSSVPSTLTLLSPWHEPGTVITEIAGVKSQIQSELTALPERMQAWIGGSHPLCGPERSGPLASRSDLFAGSPCLIVPYRRTARAVLPLLKNFWRQLGCHTFVHVTPSRHDQWMAHISHLPHVIAWALTQTTESASSKNTALKKMTGPSFRDATRVAASSPKLWAEIFRTNRRELRTAIEALRRELAQVSKRLNQSTPRDLIKWIEQASRCHGRFGS